MDLTIYPTAKEHTFFSAVQGTFSKTGHILRHKVSFNKKKKIEINSCTLSDQNGIKLEKKKLHKIFKHVENEQYIFYFILLFLHLLTCVYIIWATPTTLLPGTIYFQIISGPLKN
jgi:hypothetical protein